VVGREIHRRLGLLALVGLAAAAAAIAVRTPTVPSAAAASTTRPPSIPVSERMAPCPFPANLRGYFEAAANDTQLPIALLYAVAKVESNLRQSARSAAGARGLLQLMPATARSLDLDPDQASSNVLAGARYLKQLFTQFNSADLAIAAYNAGPTAVAAAGQAPSADVVQYVANVDAQWRSVAGCS
jgi:soluble lytic murein transglycosylase-like protein